MQNKIISKNRKKASGRPAWFEIPADDPARANAFYLKLFRWQLNRLPRMDDYWHTDNGAADASQDGGLMKRMYSAHAITNYIGVPSVTRFMAKVANWAEAYVNPKLYYQGRVIWRSARTRKTRSLPCRK